MEKEAGGTGSNQEMNTTTGKTHSFTNGSVTRTNDNLQLRKHPNQPYPATTPGHSNYNKPLHRYDRWTGQSILNTSYAADRSGMETRSTMLIRSLPNNL